MKAPVNFNSRKYNELKGEAVRIAKSLYEQWNRPRDTQHFLSEKISDAIAFHMVGDDSFVLLGFFKCEGIYISNRANEHGFWVTVRSDFVDSGILRSVSKVHPKRVNK